MAPVGGALDGACPAHLPLRPSVATTHDAVEETAMTWEAPDFAEIKMDAEINSYQDDFGGEDQDDRF
jgi:hypothetical protein